MERKIFLLGLEWDSLSLAKKVQEAFIVRKFTTKKGEKLYEHNLTMGFSENFSESAFIIEGFDHKNKYGIVVTLPNKKNEIKIMGGEFNKEASIPAKYNKSFNDLTKASKYFDEALREYDEEIKK